MPFSPPSGSVSGSGSDAAPAAVVTRPDRAAQFRLALHDRHFQLCGVLMQQWVHRHGLNSFQDFLADLSDSLSEADRGWLAAVVRNERCPQPQALPGQPPSAPLTGSRSAQLTASEPLQSDQPEGGAMIAADLQAQGERHELGGVTPHDPAVAGAGLLAEPAQAGVLPEHDREAGLRAEDATAQRAVAAVDAALLELQQIQEPQEADGGVFAFPPPVQPRPEPLPLPDVLPNLPPPPVFHLGGSAPQQECLPVSIKEPAAALPAPSPGRRVSAWLERRGLLAWLPLAHFARFEEPGGDPVDLLDDDAEDVAESDSDNEGLLEPDLETASAAPLLTAAAAADLPMVSREDAAASEQQSWPPASADTTVPETRRERRRLVDLRALPDALAAQGPAPGPSALADLRCWLPGEQLPRAS